MVRVAIGLMVVGLLGCGTASQQATTKSISGASWLEADRLFRSEARWLGGDAAFSVDLGQGRTLWLFGDTFVATSAAGKRSESKMVRNTVAIQQGTDPASATIAFCWNESGAEPASFFAEQGETWHWPGHGVRLGQSLLLFLARVQRDEDPKSLGFRAVGWTARMVDNPDDPPSSWRMRELAAPATSFAVVAGISVLVEGEFLYAFGVREPGNHDVVLLRWPLSRARQGDLGDPQWWTGRGGWVSHRQLGSAEPTALLAGSTEFSVFHVPRLGGYLYVESHGFGASAIAVRTAPALTGPWSDRRTVFRPPESGRERVLVYAGKAHPQLAGGDLVVTYASNSLDFMTLVQDTSLYYPRFVKLTIGE